VARTTHDLRAPFRYWDGTGWVADSAAAVNISPSVAPDGTARVINPTQVAHVDDHWIAVTKEGDWWGTRIYLDVAVCRPPLAMISIAESIVSIRSRRSVHCNAASSARRAPATAASRRATAAAGSIVAAAVTTSRTSLLDTQAGDRPGDDELLDLAGALEDRVDQTLRFRRCCSVLRRAI
jgi:hypothetical protein